MSVFWLIAVFTALQLVPSLAKAFLRLFFRCLGWSFLRRTRTRRQIIESRVKAEEDGFQERQVDSVTKEDEDWEKVESNPLASAPNGALLEGQGWQGIIGFFHPFWSVRGKPTSSCC